MEVKPNAIVYNRHVLQHGSEWGVFNPKKPKKPKITMESPFLGFGFYWVYWVLLDIFKDFFKKLSRKAFLLTVMLLKWSLKVALALLKFVLADFFD